MKSDLVGVYRQNQDAKESPSFHITRQEARELKQLDQGFFINCGRDLRLIEYVENANEPQQEKARGSRQSLKIPPRTIAVAIGLHRNSEDRKKLYPFLRRR